MKNLSPKQKAFITLTALRGENISIARQTELLNYLTPNEVIAIELEKGALNS